MALSFLQAKRHKTNKTGNSVMVMFRMFNTLKVGCKDVRLQGYRVVIGLGFEGGVNWLIG